MTLEFDPEADAAYFEISPSAVATTKEIEPGIFGDYAAAGHLVGLEVLSVSQRAKDMIEDAARIAAIRQGEHSRLISRDDVFTLLPRV